MPVIESDIFVLGWPMRSPIARQTCLPSHASVHILVPAVEVAFHCIVIMGDDAHNFSSQLGLQVSVAWMLE